jgi:cell division protein FtsB
VTLVLVLFGVMVSYLNPLVNLVDAWRDSGASRDRLAQLEMKHSRLAEEVRDAGSPLTVEREARKLGMVRPGEHAYVVHGLGQ